MRERSLNLLKHRHLRTRWNVTPNRDTRCRRLRCEMLEDRRLLSAVVVDPTSGLVTTELGGAATFSVVLDTEPTADVTIGLSSSDTTEGTISLASLTFTSGNWNTPQTVTVTGADDHVADGNVAYTILTAAAVSTDANYNGLNAPDVAVTNNDNDVAGITVTPTSGLVTTELGGTATFSVVLDTEPTADVTIGLSSSDTTEGTISLASLTFTSGNWNTPQTVTVTGADDHVADGNVAYTILTAAAVSIDANYSGWNAADVAMTNNALVRIIDNGDPGYGITGVWHDYAAGYMSDTQFAEPGAGESYATWTFTGLTPGQYRVSATWLASWTNALNAPFTIYDGTTALATVRVNQWTASAGFTDGGASWQDLGDSFNGGLYDIYSGTLTIKLRNNTNSGHTVGGHPVADAVRIERGGTPAPQELRIIDNGDPGYTPVGPWVWSPDGYGGDMHYATPGWGESQMTWTFAGLTPGLYRVSTTWEPVSTHASNASFTVSDGSTALATVEVYQREAPGSFPDLDHAGTAWQDLGNVYTIYGNTLYVQLHNRFANGCPVADAVRIERVGDLPAVTAEISPVSPLIVDNRDFGSYQPSGPWTWTSFGYGGDAHWAQPGAGESNIVWIFANLMPGRYRVSTTWIPASTNAINSPFTISDGATPLATVLVDQQVAPIGFVDGVMWQDLGGVYNIQGNTLYVQLTSRWADGCPVADAVRIERLVALTVDAATLPQGSAEAVSDAQLAVIVVEAQQRWQAQLGCMATTGLSGVRAEVGDLPGGLLGAAAGKAIRIDRDAAGYGWFVDLTPTDDGEFADLLGAHALAAQKGSAAEQRVDLLTTVMHEMGHVLGLDDTTVAGDLMDAVLPLGVRRTWHTF
jgi:hypothetical protein